MKTYKESLDILTKLNEDQLNTEIKFIPVGVPESETTTLTCEEIASS